LPNGKASEARQLPCWLDSWRARKELKKGENRSGESYQEIEKPEIFISVVVPAYNEEARLTGMLEEAVDFLQTHYGDPHGTNVERKTPSKTSSEKKTNGDSLSSNGRANSQTSERGWEILIVSDGSTDKTVETALEFAKEHQLSEYPSRKPGPWSPNPQHSTNIPHGAIRVVALELNRGKGGAVTHGMRHVRGQYTIFADADGASKFDDLAALISACQSVEDYEGRGVAIGSRAHLVGSEAVVKVFSSTV
jgi:dolichyl-phosphate beta-glucosyltransferase